MKCIIETNCKSEVKTIRMKIDRCVIALETKVFLFNLADFSVIDSVETCPNPKGLCSIASMSDSLILAYPSKNVGFIEVFFEKNSQRKSAQAHKSTLSALELCPKGMKLATASEKGTIIRIYDTSTMECIQ